MISKRIRKDYSASPVTSEPGQPASDFRTDVVGCLPQLRAFARVLTGNRDRADDLVNDTILRALGAEHQFKPGTNLRAWLFTILRNQHISEFRRRRLEAGSVDDLPEALLTTPAVQQSMVEFNEVRKLLLQMPVKFREALILVAGAGLSYEEAAAICECAVGTVKSRVNRARAELQNLMQNPVMVTEQPERPVNRIAIP